jgi:hypothetical protein
MDGGFMSLFPAVPFDLCLPRRSPVKAGHLISDLSRRLGREGGEAGSGSCSLIVCNVRSLPTHRTQNTTVLIFISIFSLDQMLWTKDTDAAEWLQISD